MRLCDIARIKNEKAKNEEKTSVERLAEASDHAQAPTFPDGIICVIRNIHPSLHAADLRRFFSELLEDGCFLCFHYLHRAEEPSADAESSSSQTRCGRCCVIVVKDAEAADRLIKGYNGKQWSDRKCEPLPSRCVAQQLASDAAAPPTASSPAGSTQPSRTAAVDGGYYSQSGRKFARRGDKKSLPCLKDKQPAGPQSLLSQLGSLQEMHPPAGLPRGNVGTPRQIILQHVNNCVLPSGVLRRLCIRGTVKSSRKYGAVPPPDYYSSGAGLGLERASIAEDDEVWGSSSDDEERSAEEWERHLAWNPEDATGPPGDSSRRAQRVFEEEVELVWEKGGSGLCFWTDEVYWRQLEADQDEADEWDVDLEATATQQRQQQRRRKEREEKIATFREDAGSSGAVPPEKEQYSPPTEDNRGEDPTVGGWEKWSNGVASKIMLAQGWRQGEGLGRGPRVGSTRPIEVFANNMRYGLGHAGKREERQRLEAEVRRKARPLLSCIYDEAGDDEVDDRIGGGSVVGNANTRKDTVCPRSERKRSRREATEVWGEPLKKRAK